MNYTTTGIVRIGHGILALSEAQAAVRRRGLQPLGDGRFKVTAPLEFKAGETIGFDGEAPKVLMHLLQADETPAVLKRPRKAAQSPDPSPQS